MPATLDSKGAVVRTDGGDCDGDVLRGGGSYATEGGYGGLFRAPVEGFFQGIAGGDLIADFTPENFGQGLALG